jgi:tetratricopeptide (TPR) repeat protein
LAHELESALVEGRYRDARRLLGAGAEPGHGLVPGEASLVARAAVEMRDWDRAAALEPDRVPAGDRDSAWFVWGLAHARLAWPGARPDHTRRARQAATVLDEMASRLGRSNRTEVRHLAVRAAIAAAEEERDEMAVLLDRARVVDDLLVQAGLGADPVVALPELEGDLWLQVSRFRDAVDAYRRAVAQPGPVRPRAWLGLARAHARLDATDAARAAAREAAALWHRADPDLPELAELRVLLWGR